jgi:hypothetical protein
VQRSHHADTVNVMHVRLLIAPLFVAAALAVMPGAAGAAKAAKAAKAPWATINECSPTDAPGAIGIRASMPGDGVSAQKMFVDLVLQFQLPNGKWRAVPTQGDSGFIALGSAKAKERQGGHTFDVIPKPDVATPTVLRGVATFQWRTGDGTVVRTARKLTTAGRVSSAGADPPGYSAATCTLLPTS